MFKLCLLVGMFVCEQDYPKINEQISTRNFFTLIDPSSTEHHNDMMSYDVWKAK